MPARKAIRPHAHKYCLFFSFVVMFASGICIGYGLPMASLEAASAHGTTSILSPSVHSGTFETPVQSTSKEEEEALTTDATLETSPGKEAVRMTNGTDQASVIPVGGNATTPLRLLVQTLRRGAQSFARAVRNTTTTLSAATTSEYKGDDETATPTAVAETKTDEHDNENDSDNGSSLIRRVHTMLPLARVMNDTRHQHNQPNKGEQNGGNYTSHSSTRAWLREMSQRTVRLGGAARQWVAQKWRDGREWWTNRRADGTQVQIVSRNETMIVGRVNGGALAGGAARPPTRAWVSTTDDGTRLTVWIALRNGSVIAHHLNTGVSQPALKDGADVISNSNDRNNNMKVNVSGIAVRPDTDGRGYTIIVPRQRGMTAALSSNEGKSEERLLEKQKKRTGWSVRAEEDDVHFLTTQMECQRKHGTSGIRRMLCTCGSVHATHVGKRLLCVARVADKVVRAARHVGADGVAREVRAAAMACRKAGGGVAESEACLTSALRNTAGDESAFHLAHGRSILSSKTKSRTKMETETTEGSEDGGLGENVAIGSSAAATTRRRSGGDDNGSGSGGNGARGGNEGRGASGGGGNGRSSNTGDEDGSDEGRMVDRVMARQVFSVRDASVAATATAADDGTSDDKYDDSRDGALAPSSSWLVIARVVMSVAYITGAALLAACTIDVVRQVRRHRNGTRHTSDLARLPAAVRRVYSRVTSCG